MQAKQRKKVKGPPVAPCLTVVRRCTVFTCCSSVWLGPVSRPCGGEAPEMQARNIVNRASVDQELPILRQELLAESSRRIAGVIFDQDGGNHEHPA